MINMESKILSMDEKYALHKLIMDTLNKNHYKNEEIINIETPLLFRASENEYRSSSFHKSCDNKGPTITIIYNKCNHVFGGFINVSWNCESRYKIKRDPDAFLFVIRPTSESYGLIDKRQSSDYAAEIVWSLKNWGPVFGSGNDLCVHDKCNIFGAANGCFSSSFDFDPTVLCGNEIDERKHSWFQVLEYEIFSLVIQ